jgi:hypothetical protein
MSIGLFLLQTSADVMDKMFDVLSHVWPEESLTRKI